MSIDFIEKDLAETIKSVLKSKKISMRKLSEEIDIPYRTVQNYLNGDARIPAVFLLKVCHYLDIESDYLIYKDFLLRGSDFYDAVYDVLLQENIIPNTNNWDEIIKNNNFATKISTSIREKYNFYRNQSLGTKSYGFGVTNILQYGQRQGSLRSTSNDEEKE